MTIGSNLIKENSFFTGLDAKSAVAIAGIARRRNCTAGEILFSEGEAADAIYILVVGAVDLVKYSSDGRESLIRSVKRGELFAEAAVFSGGTYPVTAVARSRSELLSISKDRFLKYLGEHPEVSLKIMGVMAGLLRHMNALLSDLALGSVPARLAAYLMKRARDDGNPFSLGIQKKELASRLGTIPETLSRNLKRFKEEGAISVAGDKITIDDFDVLDELAEK